MRTFSFGGGVQSMAVLVLTAQEKLSYDHFLFANVGHSSENPRTLEYMEEHALPFAQKHELSLLNLPREFQIGVRKGQVETLYGRLTREGSRSVPIPVRMSSGAPGTRSCTAHFKID